MKNRELNQDAVDLAVVVQNVKQFQQLGFRCLLRERIHGAVDPAFLAVFFLIANIDLRGGIVSHQHNGQSGPVSKGCKPFHFRCNILFTKSRKSFSVQNS